MKLVGTYHPYSIHGMWILLWKSFKSTHRVFWLVPGFFQKIFGYIFIITKRIVL